jgi:hypothetical protein
VSVEHRPGSARFFFRSHRAQPANFRAATTIEYMRGIGNRRFSKHSTATKNGPASLEVRA